MTDYVFVGWYPVLADGSISDYAITQDTVFTADTDVVAIWQYVGDTVFAELDPASDGYIPTVALMMYIEDAALAGQDSLVVYVDAPHNSDIMVESEVFAYANDPALDIDLIFMINDTSDYARWMVWSFDSSTGNVITNTDQNLGWYYGATEDLMTNVSDLFPVGSTQYYVSLRHSGVFAANATLSLPLPSSYYALGQMLYNYFVDESGDSYAVTEGQTDYVYLSYNDQYATDFDASHASTYVISSAVADAENVSPKTGDTADMTIWVVLAIVAVAGAAFLVSISKSIN